jgi:hypothetical protein
MQQQPVNLDEQVRLSADEVSPVNRFLAGLMTKPPALGLRAG